MEGVGKTIFLKSLVINKRMAGNEIEGTFYVNCSTAEKADELFQLMTRVKDYMTERRWVGIPDVLFKEMCDFSVSNLYKYALRLRDDVFLFQVERTDIPPDATKWCGKKVADCDLVIQDFGYYCPYR
jgi:hypothetical protein